jgi:hypothetical protein
VASSDGGDIQCQYAETIYTDFLEFPLGGDYTYVNGFLECPKWALTVQRNLADSIIRLTANGKQYVMNEATALSRGAYVSSACKTDREHYAIFFLYITNNRYSRTKPNGFLCFKITDTVDQEDEATAVEQAAVAAAPIAAIAAISPPPLNMFPPQGAPQPGVVSQGGGLTPKNALSVRSDVNKFIQHCNV